MLPIPNNPDPDLVRQVRRGERDAYLELVRRHWRPVRAIVEARIPTSPKVDEETVAAFERIYRTLFVIRDLTWFHLFAVRTAQAHLDSQAYSADALPSEAPEWMSKLTLGQREALFFQQRAEAHLHFPAIEYLGITREAYEARHERGRATLAKAQEWGDAEWPEAPADGLGDELATRVDALLGPRRETKIAGRRLPKLPLPLAFLLAIAVSGILVTFVFRPPESRAGEVRRVGIYTKGEIQLTEGVRMTARDGSLIDAFSDGSFRLRRGGLTLEHDGKSKAIVLQLGKREIRIASGRASAQRVETEWHFALEKGNATWQTIAGGKDTRESQAAQPDSAPRTARQISGELRWRVIGK